MPTNILMPALSPTMEKGNLAQVAQEGRRQDQVGRRHRRDRDRQGDDGIRGGRRGHAGQDRGAGRHAGRGRQFGDRGAGGRRRGREGGGRGRRRAAPAPKPAEAPKPQAAPPRTAAPPPQAASPPRPAMPPSPQPARDERWQSRLFFAARAPPRERSRHRSIARPGSGPHGRVIARDIEEAKSGKGLRAPGAAPAPRRQAPASRRRCRTSKSARCTKTAPTTSSRTTACAAPSRSA